MRSFLSPERSPDPSSINLVLTEVPDNHVVEEELGAGVEYQSLIYGQGETPRDTLDNLEVYLRAHSQQNNRSERFAPFFSIENRDSAINTLNSIEGALVSEGIEPNNWRIRARNYHHDSLAEAANYIDGKEIPLKAHIESEEGRDGQAEIAVGYHENGEEALYGFTDLEGRSEGSYLEEGTSREVTGVPEPINSVEEVLRQYDLI